MRCLLGKAKLQVPSIPQGASKGPLVTTIASWVAALGAEVSKPDRPRDAFKGFKAIGGCCHRRYSLQEKHNFTFLTAFHKYFSSIQDKVCPPKK